MPCLRVFLHDHRFSCHQTADDLHHKPLKPAGSSGFWPGFTETGTRKSRRSHSFPFKWVNMQTGGFRHLHSHSIYRGLYYIKDKAAGISAGTPNDRCISYWDMNWFLGPNAMMIRCEGIYRVLSGSWLKCSRLNITLSYICQIYYKSPALKSSVWC